MPDGHCEQQMAMSRAFLGTCGLAPRLHPGVVHDWHRRAAAPCRSPDFGIATAVVGGLTTRRRHTPLPRRWSGVHFEPREHGALSRDVEETP